MSSPYFQGCKMKNMKIKILLLTLLLVNGAVSAQTNNAYGDNQKEMEPGVFAIFSGDTNQDGVVDFIDQINLDNDAINFAVGYLNTDLNGDSVVDFLDQIILDNNVFNFVAVISPANGNRFLNPGNNPGIGNASTN